MDPFRGLTATLCVTVGVLMAVVVIGSLIVIVR